MDFITLGIGTTSSIPTFVLTGLTATPNSLQVEFDARRAVAKAALARAEALKRKPQKWLLDALRSLAK